MIAKSLQTGGGLGQSGRWVFNIITPEQLCDADAGNLDVTKFEKSMLSALLSILSLDLRMNI